MTVDTAKKKKNFMNGILKTSFATISLYIGITACSQTGAMNYILQKIDRDFTPDKKIEMMQEVENETGIDLDDNENLAILHAVIENERLEDWEKKILYGFGDIIKDNPYLMLRNSYRALEKIDIEYTERPSEYKESVLAVYIPESNTILVFQKKEDLNKDILRHELIHCLFNNQNSSSLPKYFIEGTSEILENEYFGDTPFIEINTYPYEVAIVGVLCDMVGEDKVLEAYTRGNMNIITMELSKTLGIIDSLEFLNNIENVFDSFEKNGQVNATAFDNMMKTINTYLTIKFAETNDEQIAEKYFYSKDLLENMKSSKPYEDYWKFIEENGVYTNARFSSKLKQSNPIVKRINLDGTEYQGEEVTYSYVLTK